MPVLPASSSAVLYNPTNVYDSYSKQKLNISAQGSFRVDVEISDDGGTTWRKLKSYTSSATNATPYTQGLQTDTHVCSFYRVSILNLTASPNEYAYIANPRSSLYDSLVAFWKLDEVSGVRKDVLGRFDLTDNNTVTQAAGKVGNSAQFTAANSEWLSVNDAPDLRFGGNRNWTVTCWAQFGAAVVGGNSTIFNKGEPVVGSGAGAEIILLKNGTENIQSYYRNGTDTSYPGYAHSTIISPSTWYFLALSYNFLTQNLSITVNTTTQTFASVTINDGQNQPFQLGRRTLGNYHEGLIDSFGKWNRVLTSDELTSLYNSGNGKEYPF